MTAPVHDGEQKLLMKLEADHMRAQYRMQQTRKERMSDGVACRS